MKEVGELGNRELVSEVKLLRRKEKEVLYKLLLHLGEIDERKLYRDESYTSFFSYLTNGLGYSKGSAYRRVKCEVPKEAPLLSGSPASGSTVEPAFEIAFSFSPFSLENSETTDLVRA